MNRLKPLFLSAVLCAPCAAMGQTANVPANVNDCTLIQDPVELRNCVLRFEGNRTPPPNVVESYGARPNATQTDTGAIDVGRDEPGAGPRLRARDTGSSLKNQKPRPSSNDTLISIEQVPPSSKATR